MSKIFYAVNRETGDRWKKDTSGLWEHQYLVMYDSGYLAVVTEMGYDGNDIKPLDPKIWEIVNKVK